MCETNSRSSFILYDCPLDWLLRLFGSVTIVSGDKCLNGVHTGIKLNIIYCSIIHDHLKWIALYIDMYLPRQLLCWSGRSLRPICNILDRQPLSCSKIDRILSLFLDISLIYYS